MIQEERECCFLIFNKRQLSVFVDQGKETKRQPKTENKGKGVLKNLE